MIRDADGVTYCTGSSVEAQANEPDEQESTGHSTHSTHRTHRLVGAGNGRHVYCVVRDTVLAPATTQQQMLAKVPPEGRGPIVGKLVDAGRVRGVVWWGVVWCGAVE